MPFEPTLTSPLANAGAELGRYLSYLSQRQEVIASNIANADTPGYKTLEVEMPFAFAGMLEEAAGAIRPSVVEASGLTSRNDGNNVSIDREARLLAEDTLRFTLATQLIKGQIKGLRSAIEEGRSS